MTAALRPGHRGRVYFKRTKSGRYQANARVKGLNGRLYLVSAVGDTEAEASLNLEDRIIARQTSAASVLTAPGRKTWAQVADAWMASKQGSVKQSTLAQYRATLDQVLLPEIGTLAVQGATRAQLVAVLDSLRRGDRTGYFDRDKTKPRKGHKVTGKQPAVVLGMVSRYAWTIGALDHDPLARMDTKSASTRDPDRPVDEDGDDLRHLTDDECLRLADLFAAREDRKGRGGRGADPTLREMAGLMLGAGLRVGEACALRWKDVVWLDGWLDDGHVTIWVTGTHIEPRAGIVTEARRGRPKGKSSHRAVTVGEEVATMLRERLERATYTSPDDYVFASRNGTMPWPANLRTGWRRAVAGTDLAWTHPHVLRKTFGERVRLAHGIETAQFALGHGFKATTEGHYTRDAVRPVAVRLAPVPGLMPSRNAG